MAETSAMNSDNKVDHQDAGSVASAPSIKKEMDELVKMELLECMVCVGRSMDCFDVFNASTAASGATVLSFLSKFTAVDLAEVQNCSKSICKTCVDLINVLEQAEIEYNKLKDTFEAILMKNPLFESSFIQHQLHHSNVKTENCKSDQIRGKPRYSDESEDEPLSVKKKKRKVEKSKKRTLAKVNVRKPKAKARTSKTTRTEDGSWKCDECEMSGDTGGKADMVAHKLAVHSTRTIDNEISFKEVKTEDGSLSPCNYILPNLMEYEVEFEDYNDDDDSSNFVPDDISNSSTKSIKKSKTGPRRATVKREPVKKKKELHRCDQCNAKYTSLARLESHKAQKHDGSKPPYICEVCGAHYKHKRACDIHIAMHKGISDWKCEECNKLFPSKNALQRHNNIHTGKLNYQCDLCGKSFIHTSSFKMHKLSHSGVKPHSCDVCGLALMTRSHLKRHKRVHSGEKRHECNVCGKRFSERYNLAAHSKSHEPPGPAGAAGPPPEAQRRRLFRCHFCPERFERRYMLERHMSVVHGRTLERPPPTPRNTMSKLLKAQAQRRHPDAETKDEPGAEESAPPQKLIAQLSSASTITSWSGAYAAEFGLRPDYPH